MEYPPGFTAGGPAPDEPAAAAPPALTITAAQSVVSSFDEHQARDDTAGPSPISTPTTMLLPVRPNYASTSPQRLQYARNSAADESDEEAAGPAYSSPIVSDTDALSAEPAKLQETAAGAQQAVPASSAAVATDASDTKVEVIRPADASARSQAPQSALLTANSMLSAASAGADGLSLPSSAVQQPAYTVISKPQVARIPASSQAAITAADLATDPPPAASTDPVCVVQSAAQQPAPLPAAPAGAAGATSALQLSRSLSSLSASGSVARQRRSRVGEVCSQSNYQQQAGAVQQQSVLQLSPVVQLEQQQPPVEQQQAVPVQQNMLQDQQQQSGLEQQQAVPQSAYVLGQQLGPQQQAQVGHQQQPLMHSSTVSQEQQVGMTEQKLPTQPGLVLRQQQASHVPQPSPAQQLQPASQEQQHPSKQKPAIAALQTAETLAVSGTGNGLSLSGWGDTDGPSRSSKEAAAAEMLERAGSARPKTTAAATAAKLQRETAMEAATSLLQQRQPNTDSHAMTTTNCTAHPTSAQSVAAGSRAATPVENTAAGTAAAAAAVKPADTSASPPQSIMTPMYSKAASSSVLSIHIKRSAALLPDILVTNPVVRLHVVHATTGEYVRQVQHLPLAALQQQHTSAQQQQHGLFGRPGDSNIDGAAAVAMRHVIESSVQEKMLESPGRPALTTVDNNTPCPQPALLEYIPPIQTRPYNLLQGCGSGLAAEWQEDLVLDVSPEGLAAADAVLLLEVLQLPNGFARFKHHAQDFGPGGSGHALAWAFLRLQGIKQEQLREPLSLQLQLYCYKSAALGDVGVWSKGITGPHPATPAKAAFLSWRSYGLDAIASNSHSSGCSSLASPSSPVRAAFAGLWSRGSNTTAAAGADANATVQRPASPLAMPWGGQQQQSPGKAFKGTERYPSFLEVTLSAKPRPAPEVLMVVTDPAAGVRPDVPAGYGTGFEHGRIPWGLLHKPRAAGAANGAANVAAATNDACELALLDQELLLLESNLHRPLTQPCRVPNAVLVNIKGTAGGCSCISTSRDGRWLAAACADAAGHFKVVVHQALTGRLWCVLGTHNGMVYSISWAKDDSCIVTASADYTAKVWHLPVLPHPGHSTQQLQYGDTGLSSTVDTSSSTAGLSSTGAADNAGVVCTVLQHKCFVYAAEMHPVQLQSVLAVTGAYDGCVRVWSATDGQQLSMLQVSCSPINCLALTQLGSRMFTGDNAGVISELSLDVTPLATSTSATAAATLRVGACAEDACGSVNESLVRQQQGSSTTKQQPLRAAAPAGVAANAAAVAAADAVSPVAAVIRHGSVASRLVTGCDLLKVLRVSNELAGSPIASLACHPGGHQLIILTKCCKSKGALSRSKNSEVVVLDMKLLLVARRMSDVRCSLAPIKFSMSPDGEFITCGSENGPSMIWDFASGTPTYVPHMDLGGAPVYCISWNNCFHTTALCSFSAYAPIRVLCWDPDEPQVLLNPPQQGAAAAAAKQQKKAKAHEVANGAALRSRYVLPDQLTPHHVHALLADIRASAAQRGLYKQHDDPEGQHLVVRKDTANYSATAAQTRQHSRNSSSAGGEQIADAKNPAASAAQQHRAGLHTVSQSTDATVCAASQSCSEENSYQRQQELGQIDPQSADHGDEQYSTAEATSDAAAKFSAGNAELGAAGGRNRQRVMNRKQQQTLGVDLGHPCSPKVVVNRKGGTAGVAAPWMQ